VPGFGGWPSQAFIAPKLSSRVAGGPVNASSSKDFQDGCPIQGREAALSGGFRAETVELLRRRAIWPFVLGWLMFAGALAAFNQFCNRAQGIVYVVSSWELASHVRF